jgi:hypothetical protein
VDVTDDVDGWHLGMYQLRERVRRDRIWLLSLP